MQGASNQTGLIAPSKYIGLACAEVGGYHPNLFTGGLGILFYDWLLEAADRGWPVIGISLGYHKGSRQRINSEGWQVEEDIDFNPLEHGFAPLERTIQTNITGRSVTVGGFVKYIQGRKSRVPLVLETTNLPGNTDFDKGLTARVYDDGNGQKDYYRTAQYRILASAVRLMQANGIDVEHWVINDGHPAFIGLELKNQGLTDGQIKEKLRFITHTPVGAAYDYLDFSKVKDALRDEADKLVPYLKDGKLGMAELAVALSGAVIGVSRKHAEVSTTMGTFRDVNLGYATNGVHMPSWIHPEKAKVYRASLGDILENPELLRDAHNLDYFAFLRAHEQAQKELFDFIKDRTGVQFQDGYLTLGSARRFAAYKRGDLIFNGDPSNIARILKDHGQIISAGKANPNDTPGKKVLQRVWLQSEMLRKKYGVPAVVITDYDRKVAEFLVRGIDVWLNNPRRGEEASGTSGMKVAINGGINLSVRDGWWDEAYDGTNGWAIAPENLGNLDDADAHSIHELLEHRIIPIFNTPQWQRISQSSIALGAHFNTFRNFGEVLQRANIPLEDLVRKEDRAA